MEGWHVEVPGKGSGKVEMSWMWWSDMLS